MVSPNFSKCLAPLCAGAGKAAWAIRGRKPKFADICIFNSTGRPQAKLALDHCRRGKFVGPSCLDNSVPVAALMGQEHHCVGNEWIDLKASAKKAGWTMTGDAAASPSSAGASLAVRSSYHTGLTKGSREDCSPKDSRGRLATGWIDGIVRDGILLLSIYLWDGEGLTTRNRAILHAAGDVIKRNGGPWILGGDFNTTPQDLKLAMHDWLKTVGGDVCAPGNFTCKNRFGGRTIDFFIVDIRISHGVQGVWVQMDLPSSPHFLVVLRIQADASQTQVLKIIAPKSFEPRPLTGCERKPVVEPSCEEAIASMQTSTDVDKHFHELAGAAEGHLCHVFDRVLLDGSPDPKNLGRGSELPRKMRPAIPMNGREHGISDGRELGLTIMHLRLCELAALLLRHQLTPERCQPQFFAQWNAIVGKLRRPTGFLKTATDGTKLEFLLKVFGNARVSDFHLRTLMLQCASEVNNEIKLRESRANKEAKHSYDRWIDDQLRMGAGALHRLTKRTDAPIEEAVYVHPPKTVAVIAQEKDAAQKAKEKRADKDKMKKDDAKAWRDACLAATPVTVHLSDDINVGVSYRPCHHCPCLQRDPLDVHCRGCGEAFILRSCAPCGARGIPNMFCGDCGCATSLPVRPAVYACVCSEPFSGNGYCTSCGGIRADVSDVNLNQSRRDTSKQSSSCDSNLGTAMLSQESRTQQMLSRKVTSEFLEVNAGVASRNPMHPNIKKHDVLSQAGWPKIWRRRTGESTAW